MFNIIAVSNRKLCKVSLAEQIDWIAKVDKPDRLILREKDLPEEEYEKLAVEIIRVCQKNQIDCILHHYIQVGIHLNCKKIHLPLSVFKENKAELQHFEEIGVSIHSVKEALWTEANGATYLSAGHIFATECKKGARARGIEFLREVCESVSIPVYAIGGIQKENIPSLKEAGASGACMMSGFMNL